jgi:hypothetical protein
MILSQPGWGFFPGNIPNHRINGKEINHIFPGHGHADGLKEGVRL